jgi:hypothetical protein
LLQPIPLAVLIFAPAVFAASISVNGNCQVGNCGSPDTVQVGTALSTAFNFTITLPNSDQYAIVGAVNASVAGTAISIVSPFTVTYIGNQSGTSSAGDVITVTVAQGFNLGFSRRIRRNRPAEGSADRSAREPMCRFRCR